MSEHDWSSIETIVILILAFLFALALAVVCVRSAFAWDNSPAFAHEFREPTTYKSGAPLTDLAGCTLEVSTTTGQSQVRHWQSTSPSGGGTRRWTWLATLGAEPAGCGHAEIYCSTATTRGDSATMDFVFAGCLVDPPPDANEPVPVPEPNNPVPPPVTVDLPHYTDFLTAGCQTHTYAGRSSSTRQACRTALTSRRYTHAYVYAYNENDYGGPAFDYYADSATFRTRLAELRAVGLKPVVWLFPDDAPTVAGKSDSALKSMLSALVPQIDDLVSSYVLCLECDEYWSESKVNVLGAHLATLTSKPIGMHQLPGKYTFADASWVDYMVLQYGFGKSASTITSMTTAAKTALGKPVVAGEYSKDSESTSITLGNAGLAAGADGCGNGCTVPGTPPDPDPDPDPDPCAGCPCPDCPPPVTCPAKTPREIELEQRVRDLYQWIEQTGGTP